MDLRDESTPETPEELVKKSRAPRPTQEPAFLGAKLRNLCFNKLCSASFQQLAQRWSTDRPLGT